MEQDDAAKSLNRPVGTSFFRLENICRQPSPYVTAAASFRRRTTQMADAAALSFPAYWFHKVNEGDQTWQKRFGTHCRLNWPRRLSWRGAQWLRGTDGVIPPAEISSPHIPSSP